MAIVAGCRGTPFPQAGMVRVPTEDPHRPDLPELLQWAIPTATAPALEKGWFLPFSTQMALSSSGHQLPRKGLKYRETPDIRHS